MHEYTERNKLLYYFPRDYHHQRRENYFLSLTLDDFRQINQRYRLDYVVHLNEDLPQVALPPERIVLRGEKVTVFDVR